MAIPEKYQVQGSWMHEFHLWNQMSGSRGWWKNIHKCTVYSCEVGPSRDSINLWMHYIGTMLKVSAITNDVQFESIDLLLFWILIYCTGCLVEFACFFMKAIFARKISPYCLCWKSSSIFPVTDLGVYLILVNTSDTLHCPRCMPSNTGCCGDWLPLLFQVS